MWKNKIDHSWRGKPTYHGLEKFCLNFKKNNSTYQVDISRFAEAQGQGDTLQLSARQILHLLVDDVVNPAIIDKKIDK